MELYEIYETTLSIVAGFAERTSDHPGATSFLQTYIVALRSGIDDFDPDDFDPDEHLSVLDMAQEALNLIASDMSDFPHSDLELAIIRNLLKEIGSIRGNLRNQRLRSAGR